MPTISVDKAALFKALGQEYTTEQFDELCFEFGLELDEDTSNSERPIVNGVQEPPQLKLDIPANRYDLLCFEGIALMLNIFRGKTVLPNYRLVTPPNGALQTIVVKKETANIRPYISGAVLRNIHFDKARYDSFIALQDKLHQNLARRADKDKHLGKFLHIIRDSPVYPIIYDSKRTVCSLPPIINGDHSKITLDTRNVFMEITATDKTKVEVVNNIMVAMFSQYTSEPFTIEPIQVVSEHNNETRQVPNIKPRLTQASISYINQCCGLNLSAQEICDLLKKMAYIAKPSKSSADLIDVEVPITRADVLHEADIMGGCRYSLWFQRVAKIIP
ncbi:phenylalanyl-tRNA synthetase beta chain [Coccidioides immitis RMSCC 2394]|uniref:Phenylalanine--tRNA ligase beta subunit n=1 Tax=Coccidioides immitis RMSCC 2394 TaxID=404692 RepID=A0A0J6YLY5_COCIT|nr:phenylalanyl-tRNA synthetase beta chain [Coccidioides immitis RMSCC 2394]